MEYHDVETLNHKAFNRELAITKLSYHAFAYAVEDYELLDAGSALGFGAGPLLITKRTELAEQLAAFAGKPLPEQFHQLKAGIPGKYTTANFLRIGLSIPSKTRKSWCSPDIESALLDERIGFGTYHPRKSLYLSG